MIFQPVHPQFRDMSLAVLMGEARQRLGWEVARTVIGEMPQPVDYRFSPALFYLWWSGWKVSAE